MIYAIFLVNFEGKIISAQPSGCQFDDAFVKLTYDSEYNNAAPHPFAVEMGEGFTMIGLFSGKSQPFIILPNYVVGLVIDTAEDQESIKKNLRKLANNILLVRRDNQNQLDSYMQSLWTQVSEKQWDAIPLEKPKATDINLSPLPKPPSTPSSLNAPAQDEFKDILSLQNQALGTKQENAVGDDSFNNKPKAIDPFGGSASTDPFGGSAAADPFGGSVPRHSAASKSNPFGSPVPSPAPVSKETDLKYKPELFGGIKKKTSASIDEFSDNPFASEKSKGSSDSGADLFTDNPFEEEKPKKKEKTADPFADDPFK